MSATLPKKSLPASTFARSAKPAGRPATVGLLALAAIVATGLNAVVAVAAHAAGASSEFSPLQPSSYVGLTVVGVFAGAAGWAVVRRRSARPRALMPRLAPAVLLASLGPDVMVGVSGQMAGSSGGAVGALMVMHLVVAAVAIPTYARVLPLPVTGRARRRDDGL